MTYMGLGAKLNLDASASIKNIQDQLKSLENQKIKIDFDVDDGLKNIQNQLQELSKQKAVKINFETDSSNVNRQFEDIQKQAEKISSTNIGKGFSQNVGSEFSKMSENAKSLGTNIDQLNSKMSVLGKNPSANFAGQITEAKAKLESLNSEFTKFQGMSKSEQTNAFGKLKSDAKEATQGINQLISAEKNLNQVTSILGNLDKYLDTNPQALDRLPNKISNIKSELQSLQNESNPVKLATGVKEASSQVSAFKGEIRGLGAEGRTAFGELGNDLKKQFQWLTSGTLLFGAIAGAKEAFTNIENLDTAMVNLRKVTDESESTYTNFYKQANTDAKELGATTQSLVEETATWGQMGFKVSDASSLAKYSEILKNISSGMNASEASDTIISSMKAFGISSNDVLDGVVSKVNEVGNKFAVTNEQISTGLQKSSSAMSAAGNNINQTIGMLTAITEITRDASNAGKMIAC